MAPELNTFGDARKVSEYLKCDYRVRFDSSSLEDGSAVYCPEKDLAFWVKDDVIYAVSERAKALAPELKTAPESVTYQAVYTVTLPPVPYSSMRATEVAMHGRDISAEEAKALEADVERRPDDLWARAVLIGYYSRKYGDNEAAASVARHALWIFSNAPESIYAGMPDIRLQPVLFSSKKTPFSEAASIWKEHVQKNPENTKILGNAAAFFMISDQQFTRQCLEKCAALEPNNREWQERLAQVYSMQNMVAEMLGTASSGTQEDAKKALEAKEKAFEMTTGADARISAMGELAKLAFNAAEYEKARKYASDVLSGIKLAQGWDEGNLIHEANTVLGRLALKDGDMAKAKEYLIASASMSGSPQLDSFGPNMTFAKEMLDKGERDGVVQYLELCGKFWNKEITDTWISEIKSGKTPYMNVLSAAALTKNTPAPDKPAPVASSGSPADWNVPFIKLDLPLPLQRVDSLYGVPLLVLLGLVLLSRLFSSRQYLWILGPLAFIYIAPLALALSVPSLSRILFGLSGAAFQHLLSIYFGSLALVWLLSDVLARMKSWLAAFSAALVMAVAGFVGAINYPYKYHAAAEVLTFIIVIVSSFAVARVCCTRRYSSMRFLVFLFSFNVLFMLIVWPLLWMALILKVFGEPLFVALALLPHHLVIGLVDGAGLCVCLIPFLLVAFYVPIYREHFRTLLRLQDIQGVQDNRPS
jgi:tetratricopeptide (TPR) repeat protein